MWGHLQGTFNSRQYSSQLCQVVTSITQQVDLPSHLQNNNIKNIIQ